MISLFKMVTMNTLPLDNFPLWLVFLLVVSVFELSIEIGYRAGRWRHVRTPGEKDLVVGAMVASILGLLAFILGFTFSLAASRFEARRQVVLKEANAIGTTYLRAQFLPEPEGGTVAQLLREYVDTRLRGIDSRQTAEAVARSEPLQTLLWQQAVSAAAKTPQSYTTALFINSLNEVIDVHSERLLVGLRSRIPSVIWAGLIGLAVLGMVAMGYQAGLSVTQRSPAMVGLSLAFAVVMVLIADLDRAQEGFLRVSQEAMVDLQATMRQAGAGSVAK